MLLRKINSSCNIKYFVIFVFFSFGKITSIAAQTDSLFNEIVNYKYSKSDLISKSRLLLSKSIAANDIPKISNIVKYMNDSLEDNNYIALTSFEKILIYYYVGDYQNVTNTILTLKLANSSIDSLSKNLPKLFPKQDFLYDRVKSKIEENYIAILNNLKNTPISGEDKDFLTLNLDAILHATRSLEYQDSLNKKATIFLEKYPNSKYDNYTRQIVRVQLGSKKWGVGIDFAFISSIPTADLAQEYSPFFGMDIGFDIYVGNFIAFLRAQVSKGKNKKDIVFDKGIYEKNRNITYAVPEISVGYNIIETNRLRFTPFIGFGWAFFDISMNKEKDKDYDNYDILTGANRNAADYIFGLNFDIKIGKPIYDKYYSGRPGIIRFRYTFNVPTFNDKYNLSGNIHTLTLGIGIGSKGTRRIY